MKERTIPTDFDCGSIKRADQRLRLRYYGLKTKIFLLEPRHYLIQLLNCQEQLKQLRQVFDHEIRMMGDWATLAVEAPAQYLAAIPSLEDSNTFGEGIFLTADMLKTLLISRFPRIPFHSITVDHAKGVTLRVTVAAETTPEQQQEIEAYVHSLHLPYHQVQVNLAAKPAPPMYVGEVTFSCTDPTKPYSVRDAEFWFDQAPALYDGTVTKEQLPWFRLGTKCYLNASVWSKSDFNLRSNLMLYDTVYLSFPLEDHLEKFLAAQHLTRQDLEIMVEQGKLVAFLPNNENRYDSQLLQRFYDIQASAVVSKRGINALLATYYTELEHTYSGFWQGNAQLLKELHLACAFSDDPRLRSVGDYLVWPLRAKAESMERFQVSSPMGAASLGIQELIHPIFPEEQWQGTIEFEFLVNGDSPQIAEALQATYFPFQVADGGKPYSDAGVATLMELILHGYRYPYEHQQRQLQTYRDCLQRQQREIQLLQVDNAAPVADLLDYCARYHTTATLKKIMEGVTALPEDKQAAQIREYSHLLAEIGKEKRSFKQLAPSYLLTGAGFLPVLGMPASLLGILWQVLQDFGLPQHIKEKRIERAILSGKSTTQQEVYLLDRLSRVAKIQLPTTTE